MVLVPMDLVDTIRIPMAPMALAGASLRIGPARLHLIDMIPFREAQQMVRLGVETIPAQIVRV